MDLLATQLSDVRSRYPDATLEQTPDGQRVLVVPGVPAGGAWQPTETTLRFIVPTGFPHVHPDCFYTDAELRLASGAEPQASSPQPVFGGLFRWFSWHLATWDAANGSLEQYVRFCERRLREAR